MQSIKSKIIISMIRNRHLFKFRLKPDVVDASFDVKKFRDDIDKMSGKHNEIPGNVKAESFKIGNMYSEVITPEGAKQDKIVMYIHGGGFISGSCHTHRMHVIKFAKVCGMKMLLFDYRLAPEHPFPAAVEDCISAYNWLLSEGYEPSNIIVMGESAGGTLTLSTLIALKDQRTELPRAAVSISPITDLTCQADSFRTNAKKDIAPMGSWTIWTGFYIADNNPHHPWLSPLMADLTGLPPMMIHAGTHEIHFDDARNFAIKAEKSGVKVTLKIWEGMIHAFPLLSPLFPEAKNAMDEIGIYIRSHLG
jgi:acetyl esterase/lipase